MKCGKAGIVNRENGKIIAHSLSCKCWRCSRCAPWLKRRLVAIARKGKPNRLITLTVDPSKFKTPLDAANALTEGWRRARQQLKRHHGHEAIDFLAVWEEHKSGWPHLHILARCGWIDQAWLSAYMHARGLGKVVDIRRIYNAKHAARYVAKYVAKAPARFGRKPRWWRSRQYIPPRARKPKDKSRRWLIVHDLRAWLAYYYGQDPHEDERGNLHFEGFCPYTSWEWAPPPP